MFILPTIDPVMLAIGPLNIHWYGVMYLIGFISAWALACYRCTDKSLALTWKKKQVEDLVFYGALGVVIGGRVGYMLFYNVNSLLHEPLGIFRVWEGGMSFHGGMLGVFIALYCFGRKYHKTFFEVSDFTAPMVPIGLGAGRIGNFINGELWGRVTDVPWGVVYPYVDSNPRHPSELYQFFTEGVLLFILLWWYSSKPRPKMAVSAMFLLLYGSFRFITEFFRQPDAHLGFIAFDWLTMGQLLSLPMVAVGAVMLRTAYRQHHHA